MPKNVVDQSTGLVKSPFTISSTTPGVTWATADLTASVYSELMEYAVPLGMAVEITPVNYFFISAWSTAATTVQILTGTCRLIKKNAAETETREIWSGPLAIFKDVGDEFQRPKIRVPVILNASEKLSVEINSATVVDKDNSEVFIECMQYYEEV